MKKVIESALTKQTLPFLVIMFVLRLVRLDVVVHVFILLSTVSEEFKAPYSMLWYNVHVLLDIYCSPRDS